MTVRALPTTILLACAVACARHEPVGEGGGAALMKNLLRARDLEIVVEEKDAREPIERAAARLRQRDTLRFDATVHDRPFAGSAPRIVVGTAASQSALNLAQAIGVTVSTKPARFRYDNRDFDDPHDGLIATFADSQRPGLPITLVFANDASYAAELCGSLLPGWKPWIRVMRAGNVALSGPLEVEGSPRRPDIVRVGGQRLTTTKHLRAVAPLAPGVIGQTADDLPTATIARYVGACVRAREAVSGWCVTGAMIPSANVRMWSHADDYCANGDEHSPSRFDPSADAVDALVTETIDDGGAGVARAGAWKMLGTPAQPWMLDAAGVEAAWSWWGRDLDTWLTRVTPSSTSSASTHLAIADIVDAHVFERVSVHVISPLRGALWRFLREREKPAFLRELWSGTRALDATAELDTAFDAWLRAHADLHRAAEEQTRAGTHAAVLAAPILRGIGTCEPSFDARDGVRHGLGSRAFDEAVDAARTDGADALSVTAFGCDEAGLPSMFGDEQRLELSFREGDVRVAAAIAHAHTAGMRTLLAPELLTADGGTWSGTWSRGSEEQWRACFERQARFVEHAALLAELSGADLLSIGSGLSSISGRDSEGRRPVAAETDWKRDGWKRVITLARAGFPGGIIYSATTVAELDKVAFFPDVDYIGFHLVPTLEFDDPWDGHDPTFEIRRDIDYQLGAVARVAVASSKRIILTQACFSPDLHGAARVLASDTSSRAWQARQFSLLADSLNSWSARDRLAGVFVWRWPGDDDASSIQSHDAVIADTRVRFVVSGFLRGL